MIKIAICDDNISFLKPFHQKVVKEFEKHSIDTQIYDYTSGNLLLIHHKDEPFNLVYLDIDIPQTDGFYLAQQISSVDSSCCIVFVTNHTELIYDSFMFRPLNFISKIDHDNFGARLTTTVNQFLEHQKQEIPIILHTQERGKVAVCLHNVLYIESSNHYVIYHFTDSSETLKVRTSLTHLEQEYNDKNFVRTHKKYLVNLKHVFNIYPTDEEIVLTQGATLPMSRFYKNAVEEKLTVYLRRIK